MHPEGLPRGNDTIVAKGAKSHCLTVAMWYLDHDGAANCVVFILVQVESMNTSREIDPLPRLGRPYPPGDQVSAECRRRSSRDELAQRRHLAE